MTAQQITHEQALAILQEVQSIDEKVFQLAVANINLAAMSNKIDELESTVSALQGREGEENRPSMADDIKDEKAD